MATSGDILLAIREDFYMATDKWNDHCLGLGWHGYV